MGMFSLEDPVQFLVDNQKPLELGARYRTTNLVRVRDGESLQSKNLGTLRKGQLVRVEEQRGRRVRVQFLETDLHGWMSYVNQLGRFLLAKERDGSSVNPGTIGASELARSYGSAIELPVMGNDE